MSPPKKSARGKPVHQVAHEWLNANVHPLAAEITARIFDLDPGLLKKYGERGRAKCEEDTLFHLHYLAEAITNDSPKMFIDYVGWSKIMLCARRIDPADLGKNLDAMAHVLRLKSPRNCGKIFVQFINSALLQLPKLPETLPSFIDASHPWGKLADSYLKSLLLLDREKAISLVLSKLESGLTIGELFRFVISPVQQEVGRLWQENQITVVQEHYCSAATDSLISRLKRRFVGLPRNVSALAICPPGEQHSFGIKMFADLLESDGWMVIYIGPDCPTADVLRHLKTHATDLVAISVATPLNLGATRELITEIRSLSLEPAPAILVGGAAVNSDSKLWKHLEADGSAADVSAGVDLANRLIAQRKPRKAGTLTGT